MPPSAALTFRAVGAVPAPLLHDVLTGVSRRTTIPCSAAPPDREFDSPSANVPSVDGRDQWDADQLLAALELSAAAAGEGTIVVGLSARDMGSRIFTHFFGRARLGGRAVVVSLARLAPTFYGLAADAELTARRGALEVLHELGHIHGLRHCHRPDCLMHLAHNVEAIDQRGPAFCADCAAQLPPGMR